MAEFNYDNLAKNLPDCYKKDSGSNNYKILEIERIADEELCAFLEEINSIIDIDNATGAVLDAYGKRFGQARGKATDAQYLVMIKSKIIRGLCNGSYKNIVDAVCFTFGCDINSVSFAESTEKPMSVTLEKAPIDKIVNSGFSINEAVKIIKRLLPVGVELEHIFLDGTFEFSDTEDEYDENKGFSEKEDGEIGGYLGWAGTNEQADELPI